jgi:hypothetical protein
MLRNSVLAPSITLLLNPQRDLSDLPLKAFYRYALPDIPEGGELGGGCLTFGEIRVIAE